MKHAHVPRNSGGDITEECTVSARSRGYVMAMAGVCYLVFANKFVTGVPILKHVASESEARHRLREKIYLFPRTRAHTCRQQLVCPWNHSPETR